MEQRDVIGWPVKTICHYCEKHIKGKVITICDAIARTKDGQRTVQKQLVVGLEEHLCERTLWDIPKKKRGPAKRG